MKDPYEILGVARTATTDEIRTAYRRLAKKLHPDLNPGDKKSEERFKEVSIANDILSDEAKRKRFDSGEIDALGAEKPQPRTGRRRGATGGNRGHRAGGHHGNAAAVRAGLAGVERNGAGAHRRAGNGGGCVF